MKRRKTMDVSNSMTNENLNCFTAQDFMSQINGISEKLREISQENPDCWDGRHVAMALTKLEEAELILTRAEKHDE